MRPRRRQILRRHGERRPAAMSRLRQTRLYHPVHQNHHRRGVSLMRPARYLFGNAGALAALLIVLAAPEFPALAQAPAAAENLADQLAGSDSAPELDLAALRQQAAERSKSKATAAPGNRPPLVPELLKLPQVNLEVLFDPDSSIIRPGSYGTLGRIADALTQPALLPYRF